jgi:hypothetical protein
MIIEVKSITIRCPVALIDAAAALLERRRLERPFERISIGDIYRELLARGLEAADDPNR